MDKITDQKSPPVVIFTGGHHTSALEIATTLQSQGWKIIWFGHKYSMWKDKNFSAEFLEVTATGIEFIELKAGKLYRTYHPLKLIRIPYGFIQSFLQLYRLKRQYAKNLRGIVTFGGYLGVPVVFAGQLLGLPVISHEQTASVGLANKFISRFAQKITLAWDLAIEDKFKSKSVHIGLPLRREVVELLKHPPARKKLIYVTGGKQGSHVINQCVFSLLPQLLSEFTLIHQTGSSSVHGDFDTAVKLKQNLPEKLRDRYHIHKYLDVQKAVSALAMAEVVVSRAGAHTVYELGLFGTKSVLVPIPWSSGQEQEKNAQILSRNNQAIILPQAQLTPQNLQTAIKQASSLNPTPLKLPIDATEKMVELIKSQL